MLIFLYIVAVNEDEDNRSAASSFSDSGGLREIVLERRPEGGFGFVLQSSVKEAGCTICEHFFVIIYCRVFIYICVLHLAGRIIPESPAEFCKKLHVGDHLLAVNGKDVTRLHHTDVVGIIKRSGLRVTLHVDQPGNAFTVVSTLLCCLMVRLFMLYVVTCRRCFSQ